MSQREDELIHTFNGVTFTTRSSPELLKSLVTFDAREEDVLLVSYPKSGTHWLAEVIMHLYASNAALTSPIEFGDVSRLEQLNCLSCKRIIPTHLDGNMLPPSFRLKQCKAVYIIRNPKDIAVSMYHYYRENPNLPTVDSWPNFLEMFLKGDVVCGSWFDHVLSWEKRMHNKNTLFLFFEDMKRDLPTVVKKVSSFLGVNASESTINDICKKSSFSEMKTNTEKENHDPNHTVCALTSNRKLIFRKAKKIMYRTGTSETGEWVDWMAARKEEKNFHTKVAVMLFTQKSQVQSPLSSGAVGDWKNHFTLKQNRMFEEMFNKKMAFSEVAKHLVYEC